MNKSRQSNFELMRIISMVFIVMWHFLYHGGLFNNSVGVTNYLSVILYALLIIHVNSFVLLTGYFNHDKSFKLSKIVKLNNSMWFYKVLILVLFTPPINGANSWFVFGNVSVQPSEFTKLVLIIFVLLNYNKFLL